MNKCQFLRILENKCITLERSNITDLMLSGNDSEVKAILEQIEYNSLSNYKTDKQFERIEISEIPETLRIIFLWLLWGSGNKAKEIMANAEEWKKGLLEFIEGLKPAQVEIVQKVINEVMS